VRGDSWPIDLIHGRFNSHGGDELTGMNCLLERRLYDHSVLPVEGAENKIVDQLALLWAADPNPDPAELSSPQIIKEGLNPFVPPIAAPLGNLHSSERQIQVIMNHQDFLGPHAQRVRTSFDGSSAQVHVSLGAKQKQFMILKSSGATLPFKTAAQQPDSQRPGPSVDHHEPDVVARVAVSLPGVPKAYHKEQAGQAIQRAPLSALPPPPLRPSPPLRPPPLQPSQQPHAVR